jgi:uncharacterized protein
LNIDFLKEATAKREIRFPVKVSALARLLETLPDSKDSALEVILKFDQNDQGQAYVDVTVTGELILTCQRCLESMPFLLRSIHRLVPAYLEEKGDDLLGEMESVLVDENGFINVMEMVEDEVLLAIPMFPMHRELECGSNFTKSEDSPVEQKTQKSFAGLADLLKNSV